jgi:hypothetical protein
MDMERFVPAALLLLLAAPAESIGQQFVNWTDSSGGTINGSAVTLANLAADPRPSLSNYDLTDTPYLAMPGAGDQVAVNYLCTDDWTLTFAQPQSDVRLYAIAWRGSDGGVSPVQYAFSGPFTIESGFTGASVAGTTLSLPDGDFYDGILHFSGSFSSLSVASNANLENAQATTFGAATLPEPSLVAASVIILAMRSRSRRRTRVSTGEIP